MNIFERNNPDPNVQQYYRTASASMWLTLLNLSGESPLCDYSLMGRITTGFMGLIAVAFVTIPMGVLGAGFEDWLSPDEDGDGDEKADVEKADVEDDGEDKDKKDVDDADADGKDAGAAGEGEADVGGGTGEDTGDKTGDKQDGAAGSPKLTEGEHSATGDEATDNDKVPPLPNLNKRKTCGSHVGRPAASWAVRP